MLREEVIAIDEFLIDIDDRVEKLKNINSIVRIMDETLHKLHENVYAILSEEERESALKAIEQVENSLRSILLSVYSTIRLQLEEELKEGLVYKNT